MSIKNAKSLKFVKPGTLKSVDTVKVTVELPSVMSVHVAKLDKDMHISVSDLPASAIAYLTLYGFRQQADVHSTMTEKTFPDKAKRQAAVIEAYTERWSDLENGDIPKGGGRRSNVSRLDAIYLGMVGNTMQWSIGERRAKLVELGEGTLTRRELARMAMVRVHGKATNKAQIDAAEVATLAKAQRELDAALARESEGMEMPEVPDEIMSSEV